MAKATLELLQPSDQPLYARRRRVIDQCATGYRNRTKVQCPQNRSVAHFRMKSSI
jgi:hypothetical protein